MDAPSSSRTFVLASRASPLAKVQTYHVRDALQATFPHHKFDTRFMVTGGDKNTVDPLYLISGGKSLWTEELEECLLKGEVDIIIHSLKDMPTTLPAGCELGAILQREDPRDSLVVKKGLPYQTLEELPDGSVVGTSSVRRVAQLRRAFPHLVFADVRGNLATRLAKLDKPDGEFTAIILAHAGLSRLDMHSRITSDIDPPSLYHAVGQGALGIENRSEDEEVQTMLRAISHPETEFRCRAERACLRILEGGCSVPVGVQSIYLPSSDAPSSSLSLTGTVTSLTGELQVLQTLTTSVSTFDEADALGVSVGRALLGNGAQVILDEVNRERDAKNARDALKKKEDAEAAAAAAAALSASQSGAATSSSSPSSSPSPHSVPLASSSSPNASSSSALRYHSSRPIDLPHVDSFLNPPSAEDIRAAIRVRKMPGAWPDDEVDEEEIAALGRVLERMHVDGLGVGRERFEKVAGKDGKEWRSVREKYDKYIY